MEIKVLVAAHKKYWMPADPMYFPIHVGKYGKEGIGFPGDDTGENISAKNPSYCELTAVYWAWKNLSCDAVGLVHYRRYFSGSSFLRRLGRDKKDCILTEREAERMLSARDMILPKKRRYYIETMQSHYAHSHHPEDLEKTVRILCRMRPDYAADCAAVMAGRGAHMFNMFIMRRDCFERYCGWLFPILEALEGQIDLSGYTPCEARVFGYISELLLDVWVEHNRPSYAELPVMFMEKQNWLIKGGRFLLRKAGGGPFSPARRQSGRSGGKRG